MSTRNCQLVSATSDTSSSGAAQSCYIPLAGGGSAGHKRHCTCKLAQYDAEHHRQDYPQTQQPVRPAQVLEHACNLAGGTMLNDVDVVAGCCSSPKFQEWVAGRSIARSHQLWPPRGPPATWPDVLPAPPVAAQPPRRRQRHTAWWSTCMNGSYSRANVSHCIC